MKKELLATIFAAIALLGFGILIVYLFGQIFGDIDDVKWTRSMYLFGAVEAVAFAAAGYFFGREVNRTRAENAENRADVAEGKAEKAQAAAAGAEVKAARAKAGLESVSSVIKGQRLIQSQRAVPSAKAGSQEAVHAANAELDVLQVMVDDILASV